MRSPPATLRTVKQAPTTRSCEGPLAATIAISAISAISTISAISATSAAAVAVVAVVTYDPGLASPRVSTQPLTLWP